MAPVALSCTAARLARPVCVQEAQSSIAAPASLRGATGLRLGRSARALGSSSSSFLPQAAQQQRQSQPGRPARRCGLQCLAAAGGAAAWAAAAFDAPDGSSAVDYTKRHRFPAFLAAIRAVLFYTTTLIFAMPLFVLMLLAYPYCLQFDKYRWVLRACCFSGRLVGCRLCAAGRRVSRRALTRFTGAVFGTAPPPQNVLPPRLSASLCAGGAPST